MNRQICAVLLLVLFSVSACNHNGQAGKLEAARAAAAQVQQEALRLQAERQEAAVRRKDNARNYARKAGEQIMNAIGGGRDLIVKHNLRYYDPTAKTLEIAMEVSFNGLVWRSNNYLVSGVLTVNENGRNPKFARRAANQNYMDQETTMIAIGVIALAGGAYVLSEMSDESGDTRNKKKKPVATTWDIGELELCNGIGSENVNAAYAFTKDGKTYTSGWYILRDDKCVTIKPINERKKVYVFGISKNRTWSGGTPFCVDMVNSFEQAQATASCTNGLTTQDFFVMTLTEPSYGHMRITFDAKLDADLEKMMAEARRN